MKTSIAFFLNFNIETDFMPNLSECLYKTNSNWKKLLGFRNMQEKLEKGFGMMGNLFFHVWTTLQMIIAKWK